MQLFYIVFYIYIYLQVISNNLCKFQRNQQKTEGFWQIRNGNLWNLIKSARFYYVSFNSAPVLTETAKTRWISSECRPDIPLSQHWIFYYPEIEPPPGFFQIMRPLSFLYQMSQLFYDLIFILKFDIIYLENIRIIYVFRIIYKI